MKYYLIAGEASGDLHASELITAIRNYDADADFRCFGGDLMQQAGAVLVKHYREMAFMGFVAVLSNLNKVLGNIRMCKEDIRAYRPDAVILVDYPGFNMKIAKYVKTVFADVPVYYYISPKIWAWKEYRIKGIKKYVDKMLCILPFEVEFYRKHDYPVVYVGNPTVDELAERPYRDESTADFRRECNLADKPVIALLAGSRKQEIRDNLPVMIESASHFSDYQLVIAGAPGIDYEYYQTILGDRPVRVVFGKTYRLLQQSSAALVTSGTATLETAILRIPQVVCYRMNGGKWVYDLFKRILHVPFVSLVNLIAGREVVRELLVHLFTVENVRKELSLLLFDEDAGKKIQQGYDDVARNLGGTGASDRAAREIVGSLAGRAL